MLVKQMSTTSTMMQARTRSQQDKQHIWDFRSCSDSSSLSSLSFAEDSRSTEESTDTRTPRLLELEVVRNRFAELERSVVVASDVTVRSSSSVPIPSRSAAPLLSIATVSSSSSSLSSNGWWKKTISSPSSFPASSGS